MNLGTNITLAKITLAKTTMTDIPVLADDLFFHELLELTPRLRRFATGLSGSATQGDQLVQRACETAYAARDLRADNDRLDRVLFGDIMARLGEDRAGENDNTPAADQPTNELTEETLATARSFMNLRPPNDRATILLICLDGLPYAEAAAILGEPTDQLADRQAEIRAAMARVLTPDLPPAQSSDDGNNAGPLDDLTLTAYIDGALAPEAEANLKLMLPLNRPKELRLAALRRATTVLRAAFNAPMHEPIPDALMEAVEAARAKRLRAETWARTGRLLAIAGAAVLAGALISAAMFALQI